MTNKTTNKFSVEVRARAVRMVLEHEGDDQITIPKTFSPFYPGTGKPE